MKHRKYLGRWMGLVVVLFISFIVLPSSVNAERTQTTRGVVTQNQNNNNYYTSSQPIYSYLYKENGKFIRVEYKMDKKEIYIEYYSTKFKLQKQIKIISKSDYFGGFFAGKTANYFIFGNMNREKSSKVEVFQIVKYSKDFKKIKSIGISDCNTIFPFDAGSLRCAELGNMLYIRTAHMMYSGHQANVQLALNTETMKVTDRAIGVSNIGTGYVSHSFNQFIKADGNDIIALDQGDAYPRAMVLLKYNGQGGQTELNSTESTKIIKYKGRIGENNTGSSVGGLGISKSSYLVAYNQSVDLNAKTRDIFVSVTPKNNFTETGTKIVKLAFYKEKDGYILSTPQLVKINENRFMILWQEIKNKQEYFIDELGPSYEETERFSYVLLDGEGNLLSKVKKHYGYLSDCEPIVSGDKVIWYYTAKKSPVFVSIPIDGKSVPSSLISEDIVESGGLYYRVITSNISKRTVEVIGEEKRDGKKKSFNLNIPSTIKKDNKVFSVTHIGKKAFYYATYKNIVIGTNITTIGEYAFANIRGFKKLTIKTHKIKKIGKNAFALYSDLTIKVPASKLNDYKKLFKKNNIFLGHYVIQKI